MIRDPQTVHEYLSNFTKWLEYVFTRYTCRFAELLQSHNMCNYTNYMDWGEKSSFLEYFNTNFNTGFGVYIYMNVFFCFAVVFF